MKLKNIKGALALLIILYVVASSNNDYDNTGDDLSTTTEAVDRGRIHLFNVIDDDKKRKDKRWKDYKKNKKSKKRGK